MCGRYSLTAPGAVIAEIFALADPPEIEARYNIAPTQNAPVVRTDLSGARVLAALRWGLVPPWAPDLKLASRMINARVESVSERPAFREAFERHRCLVPADGYYEWQATAAGKLPCRIHREDGTPLAFAGLWSPWLDPKTREKIETFTILTCPATPELAAIHDRMPVILPPARWSDWLDARVPDLGDAAALSRDGARDLTFTRLGPRINNVAHDDPECWAPPVAVLRRQLGLFD